ncbi:MAG: GEVED domain-containing protein [Sedimentisphaerales bacterium]
MNWFNSKLASACAIILLIGVTQVALGVTNDDIANAEPTGDGTYIMFDTRGATFDGPGGCNYGPNVWFCYTASCTGEVTVAIEGAYFDTVLGVYDGCSSDITSSDRIGCNDDYGDSWLSQVTFAATTGKRYLIEVGGYQDYTGDGFLHIGCEGQPGPTNNDSCGNAKPVGEVADLAFDTTDATHDGPGLCMTGPNIWFLYTASCTGETTVSLVGSEYDTMLAVYGGDDCDLTSSDLIACNDDFSSSRQSQITFETTVGDVYLVEVGGYGSAVGQGVLNISCEPAAQPSKDDCAHAQAVGDVKDLPFDTTDATFDGPGACMTSPNIWFVYTASCTGNATISLLGSSYDTMLAVYEGANCDLNSGDLLVCNDDVAPYEQSEVLAPVVAGQKYLIEVGGYGSRTGQGVLNISCESGGGQPSKDDCAHAQAIGEVKDLAFDTTDATFDGPGLCMTSPNIWFVYTASCTGDATVSLLGSSFDTMLAVYEGDNCNLTSSDMIACNDDFSPGYTSQITFAATAGDEYLIEVGGYGSNTGEGVLNISCESGGAADVPDLGDAPDSTNNFGKNMNAYPAPSAVKANYPTVYDDGTGTGPFGPLHMNEQLVAFLGKSITWETEADSGPDQDGVNNITPSSGASNDDKGDDGVTMPLNLPAGRWTTFDYTVNVVDPGVDLWVNVWFDWNRDGDWDDTLDGAQGSAPEWAVQNQFLFDLPVGSNVITTPAFIPWHPQGGREQIWMRITLSEQPFKGGSDPQAKGHGGSGPEDKYVYGETEDYYFTPDVSYTVCQDFNGDGVINTDDLVDFTAVWLEDCPD